METAPFGGSGPSVAGTSAPDDAAPASTGRQFSEAAGTSQLPGAAADAPAESQRPPDVARPSFVDIVTFPFKVVAGQKPYKPSPPAKTAGEGAGKPFEAEDPSAESSPGLDVGWPKAPTHDPNKNRSEAELLRRLDALKPGGSKVAASMMEAASPSPPLSDPSGDALQTEMRKRFDALKLGEPSDAGTTDPTGSTPPANEPGQEASADPLLERFEALRPRPGRTVAPSADASEGANEDGSS